VSAGFLAVREHARAVQDHVDLALLPREGRGVALGADRDEGASNREAAINGLHALMKATVDRIALQEIREHVIAGEVVDVNEGDVVAVPGGAQDVATDPTEAVDGDAKGHGIYL
jgi:hypothetical protein